MQLTPSGLESLLAVHHAPWAFAIRSGEFLSVDGTPQFGHVQIYNSGAGNRLGPPGHSSPIAILRQLKAGLRSASL